MKRRHFKDPATNTCQDSLQRKSLNLNGRGPEFNLQKRKHWVTDFLFSCRKASDTKNVNFVRL